MIFFSSLLGRIVGIMSIAVVYSGFLQKFDLKVQHIDSKFMFSDFFGASRCFLFAANTSDIYCSFPVIILKIVQLIFVFNDVVLCIVFVGLMV